MNKKLHIIIWSSIIVSMISLNIYVYMNSLKVSKYIEVSNSHTNSIVLIDKFRTDINMMAQSSKLCLLTGKTEYKDDYEKALKNVYKTINDMNISGNITDKERDELIKVVEDYSNLNTQAMDVDAGNHISSDVETDIVKSNNAQLNVLNKLDKSVEETHKSTKETNNIVEETLKNQKGNVQTISTILTALVSAIAYYIKKNPSKAGTQVGEIIECIANIDDDKENNKELESKNNIENNKEFINMKKEVEEIKVEKENEDAQMCIDEIVKYEKILESCTLIYKQSIKMKSKVYKSNEIANEIYIYINQLKINIEECKNCSEKMRIDLLKDIQERFIELRILIATLPDYNEMIEDISTEVINSKNN
ncbi:MAG: hypothetical protein ACRC3Y_08535 [Romboutsia sp.]|uniref:hypothetical protein n=1 Tax=Romboutsia sp. TaxID=1965302 RepID=UPI003F3AB3AB